MSFLLVALGGAVGSAGRYAISLIPARDGFPVLTLATNLVGAVLIGFVVGMAGKRDGISSNATAFWKTGVCGGFTTFSTFSLEAFQLFEDKAYLSGGIYIALSVAGCVMGVFCGMKLASLVQ